MDGPDPLQQRRIGDGVGRRRAVQPSVVAGRRHAEQAGHQGNREGGLVRFMNRKTQTGSCRSRGRTRPRPGFEILVVGASILLVDAATRIGHPPGSFTTS
jgi:hypothetical protein